MPESVTLLMREFLSWIASRPRTYAETIDAWRTSCPGLTIWEDALIDGLIQIERNGSLQRSEVIVTMRGREFRDGKP
jgi:hypothetical protein